MNLLRQFINGNRYFTTKVIFLLNKALGPIDRWEEEFYEEILLVQPKTVIELGGANRPVFSKQSLQSYIGIDIDKDFETKNVYTKYYCQTCEIPIPGIAAELVVSKYLLEHVQNNHLALQSIRFYLTSGGRSVHLLPLGRHPFSLANKLVGNRIAKRLIPLLRPGSEGVTGYPAYYHLCTSKELEDELTKLGYQFRVKYFWGAEDYFAFFAPLAMGLYFFNRACYLLNLKAFASNAVVVMWIPEDPMRSSAVV